MFVQSKGTFKKILISENFLLLALFFTWGRFKFS